MFVPHFILLASVCITLFCSYVALRLDQVSSLHIPFASTGVKSTRLASALPLLFHFDWTCLSNLRLCDQVWLIPPNRFQPPPNLPHIYFNCHISAPQTLLGWSSIRFAVPPIPLDFIKYACLLYFYSIFDHSVLPCSTTFSPCFRFCSVFHPRYTVWSSISTPRVSSCSGFFHFSQFTSLLLALHYLALRVSSFGLQKLPHSALFCFILLHLARISYLISSALSILSSPDFAFSNRALWCTECFRSILIHCFTQARLRKYSLH